MIIFFFLHLALNTSHLLCGGEGMGLESDIFSFESPEVFTTPSLMRYFFDPLPRPAPPQTGDKKFMTLLLSPSDFHTLTNIPFYLYYVRVTSGKPVSGTQRIFILLFTG